MQINLNITVLEQLIELLQSCFSVEEVCKAIEPLVQQLFPHEVGAIYVMNSSKNLLEAIATWGSSTLASNPAFTPNECIALQRGQPYLADDTHHCLLCQHIRTSSLPVETFCIPMRVHGDTVGVLSVSSCQRGKLFQNRQLAEQITKHIGLALANLKLREAIKNQSFYDPLTKLYHRRYLEESLEREIQKSERNPQHLGIILFRIHCCHNRHHEPYIEPKDENSSPPHPSSGVPHPYFPDRLSQAASDFLLRKIGLFLKSQLRASDIACRYGSEEFMVLLTETPLAFTQKRAEQLRQAIKQLNLQYRNQPLGSMTISGGVASFSQHGLTGKELIRAAQAALLSAEELGGDRIVTY